MENTGPDDAVASAFIARWSGVAASELASAQSFVIDLCALLEVDKPHPTAAQDYMFERPVTFLHGDGSTSAGRIDCYKRDHFCLESKKLKLGSHTKGFDDGLLRARSQAENYARALPGTEGRPPFVLVVDVGTVIEVYAEFSKSGGTYTPFPDPRSHRIKLADLARAEVRERLRQIWLAPDSLNPARISAKVTREVAELLAQLAKSLESGSKAAPEVVASYLTRCLFSMFAEDVGLLPKGAFIGLLQSHRDDPATLQIMLRSLWADMDGGGFSIALASKVLHFNGKLFKHSAADGYSLLLTPAQIDLLIEAARANWRDVEPAIFGTLLERALDPTERHELGAHFTPRAYVERLVLPTVIEPLRAQWFNAQAAALVLAHEAAELEGKAQAAKLTEARAEVKKFHHYLCTLRVLDPACGSGNFLYVTLEHVKRLEGEVLNQLEALGLPGAGFQDHLGFEGETVTLQQLRGIELNERAAALAELVLWIGWLQWHLRTLGAGSVAEPVVHDYGNIECRDAVLAWDSQEPAYGADGALLTRWDGVSFKTHPVTGALVPDEAALVPQWKYINPRQAVWPQADFLVGNPPFIGNKRMRDALGDGYVQSLRAVWPQVPESADFVMYWWAHAAALVAHGQAQRFGLITTNSLTMIFNRRVVQAALDGECAFASVSGGVGAGYAGPLMLSKAQKSVPGIPHPDACEVSLVFAIPDHPWVDNANGAAVRIAMTVLARSSNAANLGSDPSPQGAGSDPNFADPGVGQLLTVTDEQPGEHGEMLVTLAQQVGLIHADLTVGAKVGTAQRLTANSNLCFQGMNLVGKGFRLEEVDVRALGYDPYALPKVIKPHCNARDLLQGGAFCYVIDFFGLHAEDARTQHPALYQWLLDRVKPERDLNNDLQRRRDWWLFGRSNSALRESWTGLSMIIMTSETAKHRIFVFQDLPFCPDHKLYAICSQDPLILGVLSSSVHAEWALRAGGRLGVGNDPTWTNTTTFLPFPFPAEDTGLTAELKQKISTLAEQIDIHRKRVLGLLPSNSGLPTQPDTLGRMLPGTDFCAFGSMRATAIPTPATTDVTSSTTTDVTSSTTTDIASTTITNATSSTKTKLTLTALYNVMEVLREGRELTAKEKAIHQQGLVGVLKELHDELDAAVLQAYGWGDLVPTLRQAQGERGEGEGELLTRLVALNAQRAAEEANGIVRWLRPEFQNPQKPLSRPELPAQVQQALGGDFDDQAPTGKLGSERSPFGRGSDPNLCGSDANFPAAIAWPVTLPEQVRAVAQVLSSTSAALTLADIEARFKGKGVWKKSLPMLLQTLEALGRAQRADVQGANELVASWRA